MIKTMSELQKFLVSIDSKESQTIEFKEWKDSIPDSKNKNDFRTIYGYCVGIGNEGGWTLLIWVTDKWDIVWTTAELPSGIETWIYNKTKQRISMDKISITPDRNVYMISIPSRKQWEILKRHNGVALMRINDWLTPMDEATMKKILNEGINTDWSMEICEEADIDDLLPEAIFKARENYKVKHNSLVDEINSWDDKTFLNKAKLTIKNKITKAAILLLWRPESSHFLSPSAWSITWTLYDWEQKNLDYEHFGLPLLFSVEQIFLKIRNLKYRYIREGSESIFPEEVFQYEPYIIREALNNCIAHQDYTLGGRIMVIEKPDSLTFENLWSFIPKSIEKVISDNSPELRYRNKYLADAMVNLNMIDTIGSGIRRMFTIQKAKFFPLPEYNLKNDKVSVEIIGKVLDINYGRQLAKFKDLSLLEIMMLDKVQKNKTLTKVEYQHLKAKNLIEWTMRNHYISAMLAEKINQKSDYIKQKGITDTHCQQLIIECLTKWDSGMTKKDFEDILLDKLWAGMSNEQKKHKIRNNLQKLRKDWKIYVWDWKKWHKV